MGDARERWRQLLAASPAETAGQPLRICELSVEMAGVSGAGISIVTPVGNRGVVCSTDEVSAQIEMLQLSLGEGPCVDAASSGGPVLVSDLASYDDLAAERWPTFLAAAEDAGVRALFAVPLRIGAIGVGVLDMYRMEPGLLEEQQLAFALMAADAAALALLHLDGRRLGPPLADSLDASEMQIHQATGMVSIQLDVPIDEAFVMLRARAFSLGRPLVAVARDVVERRLRFTAEE